MPVDRPDNSPNSAPYDPFDDVVDPDYDRHERVVPPRVWHRGEWDVVLAVGVGGALGALARYGLDRAIPVRSGGFPWATFVVNASGCLLIGALMVVLLDLVRPHRLVRPFLGAGVLGGYTTFSTYAVDVQQLIDERRPATAFGYLIGTVVVCLAAVGGSTVVARRLVRRRLAAVDQRDPVTEAAT
jgi:CrcB protein